MRRSIVGVSFALLLAAMPAGASTFLHTSRAELTARAEAVVVGSVLEVESFWTQDGRVIVTEARVLVEEALVGEAPSVALVRTFGGTVNGFTIEAHGFPTFAEGERLLLFLEPDAAERGAHRVLGYQEGKYRMTRDKAGREIAVPTVDAGARLLTADGRPAPAPRAVALEALRQEVLELGRRAGRIVH
jgi:hypothetical protein